MSSDIWPPSLGDETVYLQRMSDRLNAARTSLSSIVLHSFVEPTTDKWNAAWITKTALPPPIPPGTKLSWYNLRTGRINLYTTVNDLQNGLSSSGDVVLWETEKKDLSCFRFLGGLSSRGTILSASTRTDSTVTSFFLNEPLWRQRGLRKLIIYLNIQTLTSGLKLYFLNQLPLLKRGTNAVAANPPGATAIGSRVDVSKAAALYTVESSDLVESAPNSIGSIMSTDLDTISSYFMGVLEIDLANTTVEGSPKPQLTTSIAHLYGVRFPPSSAPTEVGIEGVVSAFSQRSAVNGQRWTLLTTDPTDADNEIYNNLIDTESKGWVYGLFEAPIPTEPGEY